MAAKFKELFDNCRLALLIFTVLLVLFVVFTALNINLIAVFITLFLMGMVAFFGILPHAFEASE